MQGFFEIGKVALNNLSRQGLRSYLTLIGVVIGIAAIVTIISLGNGLNNAVTQQFEKLGTNSIFIFPGAAMQGGGTAGNIKTLTPSILKKIRSIPEITEVLAPVSSTGTVEFNRKKAKISIIGSNYKEAKSWENVGFVEIADGREFESKDVFVALVGADVRDRFDKEIKVRDNIIIEGKSFKVIALTKKSSQSFGGGPNTNSTIFIPEKAFQQIFEQSDPVFAIARASTKDNVNDAKAKIDKVFEKEFGKDQKEFTATSSEQLIEQVGQILGIISLFLVGIAAISLLVGSIGIMNTMIMAVMERTKEIGLMKAIGATNNLVLTMFMLEAGFIGLIGGLIGTIIGLALAFGIGAVSETMGFSLKVTLDPMLVLGALFFAMLVGIISGFYPARNAAKLDPVEALRSSE